MAVVESMDNGVLKLDCSGKLNAVTSLELHDKLTAFMPEADSVVFDFKHLKYISSGGLRELLLAYEAMEPKGGIKIINVGPEVREVLDVTGFSVIFEIE